MAFSNRTGMLNVKERLDYLVVFLFAQNLKGEPRMKKEKTLQEVKTEIEKLEEKKESYETQLQQLKNREKILIKKAMYVYDREEVDGELKQEVEIHYKFIGKIN